MNINDVFEAELWMLIRRDYENDKCICSSLIKTLLYRNKSNEYYDLYTKRKYPVGNCFCVPGDIFINQETIIPVSSIIESKKDNMTKGKILKKYREKNGGKK